MTKHLLSMTHLDRDAITRILDTASDIAPNRSLEGRTICNLFYEASTRTRVSFELAARRLGATVVNFSADSKSSVAKGESLKDTAATLEALGVGAIVIRHPASGAPDRLARWTRGSVINAGDGMHEHPTQALLDLYTMRERFKDLEGLRVALVGDITHSRVARSNVIGLKAMGAEVVLVGPPTLVPSTASSWGASVAFDLDEVIGEVDVCYLLRMQRERQSEPLFPPADYAGRWGMTAERLARMRPEAVVMHPGPLNRGVEIGGDVADSERSLILDQVASGVTVRMSILSLLLGDEGKL